MKAVRVIQFRQAPRLEQVPIPQPGLNQVLVKVKYSPVHPADLATILGKYLGKPKAPCGLGVEGSGEIVDAGSNLRHVIGKNVSFFTTEAAWAEYSLTSITNTLDISTFDLKPASLFCINPLSSLLLLKSFKSTSFLINAGNSALARTIIKQASIDHINSIAIIRREEMKPEIEKLGAKVVVQGSEECGEMMKRLKKDGSVRDAVDLVGGKATRELFDTLAPGGTVHVVGNMSLRPISGIDDRAMRYENKEIVGFYLHHAWNALTSEQQKAMKLDLIEKYRSSLSFPIAGEHRLDSFQRAVDASKTSAAGKQLLTLV